jgi:hypothetical protein
MQIILHILFRIRVRYLYACQLRMGKDTFSIQRSS